MDYKKISLKNKRFYYNKKPLYDKTFADALKFHAPGLAAVKDESGWYHIDASGKALYEARYKRSFGYYDNRAAVRDFNNNWYHINENGRRLYSQSYLWCGNFQEGLCTVCDLEKQYFHIKLCGKPAYDERYAYAGDFKDYCAGVRLQNGKFKHIQTDGSELNGILFEDLGVFHKQYATAKDERGWFHTDRTGRALYEQRYAALEPFYNGMALAEDFYGRKIIIDESGNQVRFV
jgi:hypothetical protein